MDKSPRTSRRNVLKLGATAGLSGSVPLVGSAAASTTGEVLRKGTIEEPITQAEVRDLQRDSFESARKVDTNNIIVYPESSESEALVAYSHFIDDQGVMHSYFGYCPHPTERNVSIEACPETELSETQKNALTERLVKELNKTECNPERHHLEAAEFLRQEDTDRTLHSPSGSTSTASGDYDTPRHFDEEDAEFMRGVRDNMSGCPQGEVLTWLELFKDENTSEVWNLGSHQRKVPGSTINDCDSDWQAENLWVQHDWDDDADLAKTRPEGDKNGEVSFESISFTYGAPVIEFGYYQPDVSRTRNHGLSDLEFNWNWNSDRTEGHYLRASGFVDFDSPPSYNEHFLSARQEVEWREWRCHGGGCFWYYVTSDTSYGFVRGA